VFIHWPTPFDREEYDLAVKSLQDLPEAQAQESYENKIFPMRCQYFRDQERAPRELLVMAVGTQANGPILSCLACPSQTVLLLHTNESLPHAEMVATALAGERQFLLRSIDDYKRPQSVHEQVSACYAALGQPSDVVCDVTAGRKPTSAALAGLAALNGWDTIYLDNRMVGKRSTYEEIVPLPSLFDELGSLHLRTADACLAGRAYQAALIELKKGASQSLASLKWQQRLAWTQTAVTFREAQISRLIPLAKRNLQLNQRQRQALEGLTRDPRPAYYWAARVHIKDGNRLAAEALSVRLGMSLSDYWQAFSTQARPLQFLAKQLQEPPWLEQ
jgi:hypothetical protein